MTPAQVGLIHREHMAQVDRESGTHDPSNPAPRPAHREEQGTVADLAYWANLPLMG